jgi:hypothetical protein
MNDEARMTKSEGMTEHEIGSKSRQMPEKSSLGHRDDLNIRHLDFIILSSFVIRHSSFAL